MIAFVILLASCSNNSLDLNNNLDRNFKNSDTKLVEVYNTIKELEHENSELKQMELNFVQQTEILVALTNMKQFNYEILQQDDEIIVYVDNVPREDNMRQVYLYRAAIELSTYSDKIIHVWDDKELAEKYISGDYNKNESLLGWSGLDHMFGTINNIQNELIYRFSRDDLLILNFGKYILPN